MLTRADEADAADVEVVPVVDPAADARIVQTLVRLVAAVLVVLLAAGIAAAVAQRQDAPSALSFAADGEVPPTGGVGPIAGSLLDAYGSRRRAALDAVTGTRAAVVSFNGYVSPAQARAFVDGLRVDGFLLALPGDKPLRLAPDDVELQLRDLGQAAQDELPDLRSSAATADDPAFVAEYQQRVAERTAQVALARADGPVVFAVVLRGSGDALRRLAEVSQVRLVDVADDDVIPAVARGLRPEEGTEAGAPPTRPLG